MRQLAILLFTICAASLIVGQTCEPYQLVNFKETAFCVLKYRKAIYVPPGTTQQEFYGTQLAAIFDQVNQVGRGSIVKTGSRCLSSLATLTCAVIIPS